MSEVELKKYLIWVLDDLKEEPDCKAALFDCDYKILNDMGPYDLCPCALVKKLKAELGE